MHIARPYYYADFMKCHPLNFKGTEGAVGLTRWIEKIESVFNISGQIRTLGPDAYTMTWSVRKKKMTDKYCPLGEVKKLEIELWNLKVRDNNIPAYTNRFQELALICTKFSLKPNTLDETIELANNLMDQKLRTYAERKFDSKRKADDISINNQQLFKKQNVAKAYNLGSAEKKTYEGNAPKESRLTVISFSKVQEYKAKGCHVFLAQISATKEDDKSEGKQVKDVPIVQDFPEVFPENLPGLPPARPVEFQIDLIPGAALVARALYRLAPSEMKELSEQLQKLFDK
nr:reverse transcriptase domain-containing protein [Tanacetum cinerariifolium]